MSNRTRRKFTIEQKRQAVDDYTSGRQTAVELANKFNVTVSLIYKWKASFDQKAKTDKINEYIDNGMSRAAAIKIQAQQAEIEAYQKKVAEQAIIIDLLKKLDTKISSQPESELTGLIKTTNKLARRKKL